jgi:hypothetical protein
MENGLEQGHTSKLTAPHSGTSILRYGFLVNVVS